MNDIAILQLNKPVEFSTYVQPACLPNPKQNEPIPEFNSNLYAVGWVIEACLGYIILF